jgi:dolichol-phosphate mannosyltransferase
LAFFRNDFDYLVVDDGSPDGTADICENLKRAKKSGLGSAYRDGYRCAMGKNFIAVIQIGADGTHQASNLPKLFSQF